MAGNVRHGACRRCTEDHSGVVRSGHRHQQRKTGSHVGATSERNLTNDEIVVVVDVSHSMRVDPMSRHELRGLSSKGVGLVDIRRGARLVHQLSHPLQQDATLTFSAGGIG